MSGIKQGKTIYGMIPWGKEKSGHVKIVVELDDGSFAAVWIKKARALELAGQLIRLAK